MTSRETFLNITDQVVAAPGPGHYDPAFAQDQIKVSVLSNMSSFSLMIKHFVISLKYSSSYFYNNKSLFDSFTLILNQMV